MRTIWRTADRALLRDIGALAAAVGFVGLSFGAIATAAAPAAVGDRRRCPSLVFAGGSQFLAVPGWSPPAIRCAAVFAGLLLNARHLPFGLTVRRRGRRRGPARLLGSHLMVDESVAFALSQPDPRPAPGRLLADRRRAVRRLERRPQSAGALLGARGRGPGDLRAGRRRSRPGCSRCCCRASAPGREDPAAPWVGRRGRRGRGGRAPRSPRPACRCCSRSSRWGSAFVVPVRRRSVGRSLRAP